MNQLPAEVKLVLYRQFMFKDFLIQFRRFFRFKKQRNMMTEFAIDHIDENNIIKNKDKSQMSRESIL